MAIVTRQTAGPLVGAAPPPPGVIPNFDDPVSIANRIYPSLAIGTFLSTLFLIVRIYTKVHIIRMFGFDDVLIILAVILYAISQAFQGIGIQYGMGRHQWEVPLSWFSPGWLRSLVTMSLTSLPASMFIKLAILMFYHHLLTRRVYKWAVYLIGFVVITSYTGTGLALLFSCRPVARLWDISKEGTCSKTPERTFYVYPTLNIATNLAILLLPVPVLWRLQVPRKQKVGLGLIFAAGSLDCIISILRLFITKPLSVDNDQTWVVINFVIWVNIEFHLSVICACLLTMKPFLRRHAPSLIGERSQSQGHSRRYGVHSVDARTLGVAMPCQRSTATVDDSARDRIWPGHLQPSKSEDDVKGDEEEATEMGILEAVADPRTRISGVSRDSPKPVGANVMVSSSPSRRRDDRDGDDVWHWDPTRNIMKTTDIVVDGCDSDKDDHNDKDCHGSRSRR